MFWRCGSRGVLGVLRVEFWSLWLREENVFPVNGVEEQYVEAACVLRIENAYLSSASSVHAPSDVGQFR